MNVGFSIPIHNDSANYINEALGQYTEVNSMRLISDPIIHIYAKEDTRDLETGELNGYNDSLFSNYHFYDTKNMQVYKSNGLHDAIFFNDVEVSNVKIFKDGSTLVHLRRGEYDVSFGTAIQLYKKDWMVE